MKSKIAKTDHGFMNKKKGLSTPNAKVHNQVKSDWNKDRNAFVSMQRNFFVMLSIVSMVGVTFAMIVIKSMVEKNAIEPYVISVNNADKMPVAIPSQSVKEYATANAPVIEYFIVKYIKSREGYDFATFKYETTTTTRIMSTSEVYQTFRKYVVNNEKNNPEALFGQDSRVDVVIKNIAHNPKESIASIRIAKKVNSAFGEGKSISHFQVKLHYKLETSEMTAGEMQINPLGFKVDSYTLTEEKLFEEQDEEMIE